MAETVDAIYEDGVLRLSQPLQSVDEHSRVKVTIETLRDVQHRLADCVGILPDEDATEMRQIIEAEFEKVNPGEWR